MTTERKLTEFKERIEICRKCEHLNPVLVQCKVCGCFLHAKARMEGQDCPKGKWVLTKGEE